MKVGIPKEIKNNENRVSLTPSGVYTLVQSGHQVFVETQAGVGSGFSDQDYTQAGATILSSAQEVYAQAEMVVKVKEPIESEYTLIQPNQIVFTYFHLASSRKLTQAMIDSQAVCIAYETVELPNGTLPLLVPMSEVAGRMSVQEGAKYLEKPQGGKGKLMGGVAGVPPAKVVVIGGGVVGTQAAQIAAGMGAHVTLLDTNLDRLRYLAQIMPANVTTQYSNPYTINELVQTADIVIGAVLLAGAKAPVLISKEMLKTMEPGTVLVDVAVDQGGCFETTKATTHQNPTYEVDGVLHYCVANMPGAVPVTSTAALTNATLPYVKEIADKGWKEAVKNNKALAKGLNVVCGKITSKPVADTFELPYCPYTF